MQGGLYVSTTAVVLHLQDCCHGYQPSLNVCLQQQLDNVMKQFDVLKQKQSKRTAQDAAAEKFQKILEEAERMKTRVEDKLRLIEGSISTSLVLLVVLG